MDKRILIYKIIQRLDFLEEGCKFCLWDLLEYGEYKELNEGNKASLNNTFHNILTLEDGPKLGVVLQSKLKCDKKDGSFLYKKVLDEDKVQYIRNIIGGLAEMEKETLFRFIHLIPLELRFKLDNTEIRKLKDHFDYLVRESLIGVSFEKESNEIYIKK